MSARRTTARFSLAALTIAALTLGGAAATSTAAGEPDGLYSASSPDQSVVNGFVQLDKTNATATAVGPVSDSYMFTSVEVVNGLGYAIGYSFVDEGDDIPYVFTWDIATGAVLTSVAATLGGQPSGELEALDTTNEGVLLTYVSAAESQWVASIDPATGVVTPLIDTATAPDDRIFEGLATNPVTGVTFALADYDNGLPAYSPIDFATGTFGESVVFEEIAADLGSGWFSEGDFDASGVLWFTYGGGVARTDAPVEVGVDATELGEPDIMSKAITVGQTVVAPAPAPAAVEPVLAATGLDVAPIFGGAAVLLAAGLGLMLVRRRATV